MPPKQYIFNHIPKTGGNSVLAVCHDNLKPEEIGPHLTDHEIRLMTGADYERYPLVAGHFTVLTQMKFSRSRYSITWMRDPIRRIFSAYTFWRSAAEYNPVTTKARDCSFGDFVDYFADSPAIIHNPCVHHFAAIARDWPSYPTDDAALLAAAKHNLAAFDFVGICEKMGKSLRLLCRELGWIPPAYVPHENRSSSETRFDEIAPHTMDLLRERNRLDLELYEYAAELLQKHERGGARTHASEKNRLVAFP